MFNLNSLMAKRKTGFTLVEILVVILIIGLLFVFLVPKIDSSTDKARETGIKTDFRSYQTAFEAVAREHSGLGAKAVTDTATLVGHINGYLDPALEINTGDTTQVAKKDPWNNTYKMLYNVVADSNNGAVMVYTTGKDTTGTNVLPDMPASAGAVAADLGLDNTKNVGDNYCLLTVNVDGQIFSATAGFTTNIEAK